MAREIHTNHNFGEKPYLGFEHVTMVPLCRKLLDESLLTKRERDWINDYHREIKEKTKGYFKGDERSLRWLDRETSELDGGARGENVDAVNDAEKNEDFRK